MEEQKKSKSKHIQARMTPDEFKEVSQFMLDNDISEKSDWVKTLILREVRGYAPIQTDKRLPASKDGDGFDAFR